MENSVFQRNLSAERGNRRVAFVWTVLGKTTFSLSGHNEVWHMFIWSRRGRWTWSMNPGAFQMGQMGGHLFKWGWHESFCQLGARGQVSISLLPRLFLRNYLHTPFKKNLCSQYLSFNVLFSCLCLLCPEAPTYALSKALTHLSELTVIPQWLSSSPVSLCPKHQWPKSWFHVSYPHLGPF